MPSASKESSFTAIIWATSRENLSSGFATKVDSNWPVQPQKLARGLKFRIYKLKALHYLGANNKGADCADAQVDLRLCCSQMAKTGFLMTWLI